MANMFLGNTGGKSIPNNLRSCYQTDSVTGNLWEWSEKIEQWGKAILWLIIIGGFITAISISSIRAEVRTSNSGNTVIYSEGIFNWGSFFLTLLSTTIFAFFEFLAYRFTALKIAALASIVQHNQITANVALYTASKAESKSSTNNENSNFKAEHYSEFLSKIPSLNKESSNTSGLGTGKT